MVISQLIIANGFVFFMRKNIKRILRVFTGIFLLLNLIAGFHAYKFTHYDPSVKQGMPDGQKLSFYQKMAMLFTGVDNPRPQIDSLPTVPYQTILLPGQKDIECWLVRSGNNVPGKGTVILFHGYGSCKSSLIGRAMVFRKLGYQCLLVDFHGSGNSRGNRTTIGYYESETVKECVHFIKNQGENNIVLFGNSLGAAAIMKACADEALPVKYLILECPYGSLLQTVKNRFHILGLPGSPMAEILCFWGGALNGFNAFGLSPQEYAKKINCPVLLLWGAKDMKVTRAETNHIFQNLNGPKNLCIFENAGHDDFLKNDAPLWVNTTTEFLADK